MKQLLPKLSRANGLLAKVRHSISKETLINVYYGLFHSHLAYASMIWGQNHTDLINKICVLQNKALRIISFKGPRESSEPLYKSLHILKFDDIIALQNMIFCTKFILGKQPKALDNTFTYGNLHTHDTVKTMFRFDV